MQETTDQPNYYGKRALMFLRVSTPGQEGDSKYGLRSQEQTIREKLIDQLGLKLDEQNHIIRDTYTGLEFKEHAALRRILEMARRREIDVVVMDVLDRLGRKGIEREIYRMELREQGVRILSTDPSDFADDDTIVGELVRFVKGIQAEQELLNTKRRSMQAKRAKAQGREKDGSIGTPKVIGTGSRRYGYTYVLNEKGKRIGYKLNLEVIFVDADGTEWTEVTVVRFVFESAANGVPLRQIARILNDKGIPSPYGAKRLKSNRMKGEPVWQRAVLGRMVRTSDYWGEHIEGRTRRLGKVPGKKDPRRKTTPSEQIIVPIPAIVTKELAEKALQQVGRNQKLASRRNANPEDSLLRGGLIKCAYCGGNLTIRRDNRRSQQNGTWRIYYLCDTHDGLNGRCATGCRIPVSVADTEGWNKALEIIQNPSMVDEAVEASRTPDPTENRRKNINAKLKSIRDEQEALQDYLAERVRKRTLDDKTESRLTFNLQGLAEEEEQWMSALAQEDNAQGEWQKVQEKLSELHRKCEEMRVNLHNPDYTLTYKTQRDLLEFFGITVTAFKTGHEPPCYAEADPPSIVGHRSKMAFQRCASMIRTRASA